MQSNLNSLKKQNDSIKQKLNRLQVATKDNDENKEPQYSIEEYQTFKEQDSTPPPKRNKTSMETKSDDDLAYLNNSEKYGYNPQLNMIKNKYFKQNMTTEQYEKLIISLAMEKLTLESKVGELEQEINRLQNKKNILLYEMEQKINDNNIEYQKQMMALAKNNWSGIVEFIDLNEKSSYPLPYEQRFSLLTYYMAKKVEISKGRPLKESEQEPFIMLNMARNYWCHNNRSGDIAFVREWQSIIELMETL